MWEARKLLDAAPGTYGKLAKLIDNTLGWSKDSANISLASALALLGMLKSGRVSATGIHPNVYCCVTLPSGTGKTKAQKIVTSILEAANLDSLLMGKPGSDSGILKALSKNERKLLIWDEFGLALWEMMRSKSSYRAAIPALLTDLYSAAGKKFLGRELKHEARVDIDKPFLSVLAGSTPNRFFGSLDENFVADGFLSRWFLFFEESADDIPWDPYKITMEEIVQEIKQIEEWEREEDKGNLGFLKVKTKEIKIPTTEAVKAIDFFNAQKAQARSETEAVFWTRGFEQWVKMVLILDGHYSYAIEFVALNIENTVQKCRNALGVDSRQRMLVERVKNLIPVGGEVNIQTLTKRCWHLGLRLYERNAIIDTLLESEEWERFEVTGTNGSRKKSQTFFRRLCK